MISFGWHHRFKVHEFEKAQGEGEGGAGHAAVPVVSKSQTQLNSNNKKFIKNVFIVKPSSISSLGNTGGCNRKRRLVVYRRAWWVGAG